MDNKNESPLFIYDEIFQADSPRINLRQKYKNSNKKDKEYMENLLFTPNVRESHSYLSQTPLSIVKKMN